LYYRIKQIDFDGSVTTSDVITVTNKLEAEIRLFPNPTKENVHVYVSEFFNQIQVTDIRGNIVFEEQYSFIKQTTLNLSELSNGIYYVNLIMDDSIQTERIVIQK
jgi:hypothetical protein